MFPERSRRRKLLVVAGARPYSYFPTAQQPAPVDADQSERSDPNNGFADLQMVTNWKDVGFILTSGGG
jgi:hypothetical protein